MYPHSIQRIQHFEPADMCSRLELCLWINSNPHRNRNILFADEGPHKVNVRELLQRIFSAARSINNAAVLRKVTSSVVTRVGKFIQADGGHIKELA